MIKLNSRQIRKGLDQIPHANHPRHTTICKNNAIKLAAEENKTSGRRDITFVCSCDWVARIALTFKKFGLDLQGIYDPLCCSI